MPYRKVLDFVLIILFLIFQFDIQASTNSATSSSSCSKSVVGIPQLAQFVNLAHLFEDKVYEPGLGYAPYSLRFNGGISIVHLTQRFSDNEWVVHHRVIPPSNIDVLIYEAQIYKAVNPNGDSAYLPRSYGMKRLSTDEVVAERQFIRGKTMNEVLHALLIDHSLSAEEKVLGMVDAIEDIAEALVWFHEKGFCHNDVKPNNFIRPEDHSLPTMMIDLATATQKNSQGELIKFPPATMGNLDYIDPLALRDPLTSKTFGKNINWNSRFFKNLNAMSDFYSLSVSVFEIFHRFLNPGPKEGLPFSQKRAEWKRKKALYDFVKTKLFLKFTHPSLKERCSDPLACLTTFRMDFTSFLLKSN